MDCGMVPTPFYQHESVLILRVIKSHPTQSTLNRWQRRDGCPTAAPTGGGPDLPLLVGERQRFPADHRQLRRYPPRIFLEVLKEWGRFTPPLPAQKNPCTHLAVMLNDTDLSVMGDGPRPSPPLPP